MNPTDDSAPAASWQAANAPMQTALEEFHQTMERTGQLSQAALLAFYATLQDAYFLIPNASDADPNAADDAPLQFALDFEPLEDGLILSVFSSVERARAFFGADYKLNRIIQYAPDFLAGVLEINRSLTQNGQKLLGVALDRVGGRGYFFGVLEIEVLVQAGADVNSIRIE